MKFRIRKQYIPYDLSRGSWGVLNRLTGELMFSPNGQFEKYPEKWVRTRCKQLNEVTPCKV